MTALHLLDIPDCQDFTSAQSMINHHMQHGVENMNVAK